MLVRFWGTRGSLAKPGPTTLHYGGNTSCVEVRAEDGTLVILDGGTGLHGLGQMLLSSGVTPLKGTLLISHTHWDHIQGIPFFVPLFVPGNEWDIYGPAGLGRRLEDTLGGQMEHEYFPVTLRQMGSTIRYHDLVEGEFEAGGIRVTARFMNHPGVALGYRLEADGASVVYATDHEPHAREPFANKGTPHREDERHVKFLQLADLVIHDAQYTATEYPNKRGWGHSAAEAAVDYALAAGAKRLALFHHDPSRDDRSLTALVDHCRERAAKISRYLEVTAAAEGEAIDLGAGESEARRDIVSPADAVPAIQSLAPPTVLIAEDDPNILDAICAALANEGYRLITCDDGEQALELARAEKPDLMLVDWQMPKKDGIAVCTEIRRETDYVLRTVPVVMLTAMVSSEHTAKGFAAGVTDYLTKPASPAYLRSKVQQWLMRTRQAKSRWGA